MKKKRPSASAISLASQDSGGKLDYDSNIEQDINPSHASLSPTKKSVKFNEDQPIMKSPLEKKLVKPPKSEPTRRMSQIIKKQHEERMS